MQVANAEEKDLTELLEILDCFFDPEKKPVQPKVRFYPNQNNNRRQPRQRRNSNKQRTKKSSEAESPNASSDNPTDSVSDASPRSETKEPEVITLVAQNFHECLIKSLILTFIYDFPKLYYVYITFFYFIQKNSVCFFLYSLWKL